MNAEMPDKEELPGKISGNFFPFSSTDKMFTLAWFAIGVISWTMTNILLFFTVGVIWFMLMVKNDNSRSYEVPMILLRGIRKNVWQPGDATVSNQAGRRRRNKSKDDGDSVIPFVITSVPTGVGDGTIGIMHTKKAHTDSFVAVSEGSDIASLELATQHDRYEQIAYMVKRLVGTNRGYSVGVSFVFRKDPFDSYQFSDDLSNILHPEAILPEAVLIPDGQQLSEEQQRWLLISENWRQIQEMVAPAYGRKVWMATVVTIRREGVLAKAQSTRFLKPKDVGRLPINKMAKAVLTGLKTAGVSEPRILDRAEIHDFVRGAWDTESIDEYYQLMTETPEVAEEDGFTEHWPQHQMQVSNATSVTDGTHTAVLRITATQKQVWQGYFRELTGSIEAPYYSLALVGEAVRGNWEVAGLERVTAVLDALGEIMGVNRKTLKAEAREERLNKRKRDVFESEFSQSYVILVAINGPQEMLNEYVEQAQEAATSLGMQSKVVSMAAVQYPAKWSATTGIPML